ncbi:hypothetical protein [Paludibacterium purpuratum]|uniref:Uncharacterized protein n=1 Tax=Paludibacterium purpuratum TaxID=1144873 RepID=A0A4R7B0Z6_9NEIS|nr:hypothetical protein [Paludibacterium purpuratum]TDR76628.1 hypothetical protein DFP86_11054 [Paludibacterium purpuratum]
MDQSLKDQLSAIQVGTYLMLHGKFNDYTINPTIEQGKLKSIDWANGTLVLYSVTYDLDTTVQLDRISYIDDSRTGSGALGPAQAPDLRQVGNDWYRGDTKIE